MNKPLIPDYVWVDSLYDSLKKSYPEKSDELLKEYAVELMTMAKNKGIQMKYKRGEVDIPPDDD